MQTDRERIAELEAEVAMLAAAGKAARAGEAATGGRPTITRSQLAALSAEERMKKVLSQKYAVVDD